MEEEKGERMKQKPSIPRGRKQRKQGNIQDSPNLYAYFTRTPRVARDKVKDPANKTVQVTEPKPKNIANFEVNARDIREKTEPKSKNNTSFEFV